MHIVYNYYSFWQLKVPKGGGDFKFVTFLNFSSNFNAVFCVCKIIIFMCHWVANMFFAILFQKVA
jgi:hypothetical protein